MRRPPIPIDENRIDVMEDAVENGGGERAVVVEDLGPVLVGAVGGDHHWGALVALTDDLEQQIGAVFVDRQIAELIDDQQAGFEVAADLALEPVGCLGGGERVDDVDGGGKEHGVASDAGGMTEGDGAVSLAQANCTNEDDVGVGCDKGQAEQILDQRAVDLFWPVPLKVFHRLEDGKAGFFNASLDGAAFALGGLALDQLGQVRKVGELPLSGCGGEILVMAFYMGEVEGIELRVQTSEVTRGHGSSRRH